VPAIDSLGWHRPCSTLKCATSASQNRPARRPQEFKSYPVETLSNSPPLRRLQIATLIGDLSRSVETLTADIEHEEARAGVRDLSDPAYPVLARSLRTRRENIRVTMAMLENLRAPKARALDTTEREVA
jgi:hypothetical protein